MGDQGGATKVEQQGRGFRRQGLPQFRRRDVGNGRQLLKTVFLPQFPHQPDAEGQRDDDEGCAAMLAQGLQCGFQLGAQPPAGKNGRAGP